MDIINDVIRPYKSNKNMSKTEQIEHLKQLNRARRNKCYRKKKLEQLKLKQQQSPKFTIQKIDWDNEDVVNNDIELLSSLYETITTEPNNKELLEAIDVLEEELEIEEEDKLNFNGIFDSSSDYDSSDND
tara:strand:- start:5853 stop:6242 length:390 start_codon:yes stop_codon:yes gene_type:complete